MLSILKFTSAFSYWVGTLLRIAVKVNIASLLIGKCAKASIVENHLLFPRCSMKQNDENYILNSIL